MASVQDIKFETLSIEPKARVSKFYTRIRVSKKKMLIFQQRKNSKKHFLSERHTDGPGFENGIFCFLPPRGKGMKF